MFTLENYENVLIKYNRWY